jgi:hypothetical protein
LIKLYYALCTVKAHFEEKEGDEWKEDVIEVSIPFSCDNFEAMDVVVDGHIATRRFPVVELCRIP